MSSTKKTAVLIDGSNTYNYIKDLFNKHLPQNLDYSLLATWINDDVAVKSKLYYIGRVRAEKNNKASQELRAKQTRFLDKLANQGWIIKTGYILKSGGKYHEKGVDVQMAVDIVSMAYEKKHGKIIIISSDTDLLPAIKIARKRGILVEYIGFEGMPSYAMIKNCNTTRIVSKEDMKNNCIKLKFK